MKATIEINNLQLYCFHGWHRQENYIGANYVVNAKLFIHSYAISKDDLSLCVDYTKTVSLIKEEMAKPKKTIEFLGNIIVERLLSTFMEIDAVELSITKKNPPIEEQMESFSVVFYEERKK